MLMTMIDKNDNDDASDNINQNNDGGVSMDRFVESKHTCNSVTTTASCAPCSKHHMGIGDSQPRPSIKESSIYLSIFL